VSWSGFKTCIKKGRVKKPMAGKASREERNMESREWTN
jgi:hypothetical protein